MNANKKKYEIIRVPHYGYPFVDSDCARLLVRGMFDLWIVLLLE